MSAAVLFGKLPAHGDFIARGLSGGGMARWDSFLTACMAEAQSTVADFDDLYPAAPVWRFAIDDEAGMLVGVIASSVDRVGRRFPVLAGLCVDPSQATAAAAEAVEKALYKAFANNATADTLFDDLSAIELPYDNGTVLSGWWLSDADNAVIDRLAGNAPPRLLVRLVEFGEVVGMIAESFKIESRAESHPGKVRDHNEDSLFADDGRAVWAVADGMGGHERGEWASAAIVEAMALIPRDAEFDSRVSLTADAIHDANTAIYAEAQSKSISMGSTIVALVLGDNRFGVVWAGDSRCYVLRDGVLHQLSRDHTRVQELIDRGLLTEEQAVGHPMGHVLSRAVGVGADLELDAVVDELHAGDLFLLCSDGLYGMVSDAEIADIMNTTEYEAMPDVLIEKCLDRGAHDNVTVIVVKATAGTVLALAPQTQGLL